MSFTDSVRPVLSHAAAIEYFDAGALDILRRQREQSTAFASLPALDKEAKVCVYVELDCDDEVQATEELYHLGWVLELAGGRDDATWVARTEVDRECQRFFRHAVPESVNMLIDERRRMDPTITKLGSDMSVPNAHLADVIALYRRTLAESGLESAAWGHIGNNHLHVNILPRDAQGRRGGELLPSGLPRSRPWAVLFLPNTASARSRRLHGDDVRSRGHGRVGAAQAPARSCRAAGSR
ncbi:MAG: FAD-linked oxidase C-terminal domain-containing protein [Collinsella aerofaciens]